MLIIRIGNIYVAVKGLCNILKFFGKSDSKIKQAIESITLMMQIIIFDNQ